MKNLLLSLLAVVTLSTSSFAGMEDDPIRTTLMVDNLEYQFNDEKTITWDAFAYVGYDVNKVYLYFEGEKADGESTESENQIVYSRAILPYWDLQLGLAYDKTAEAHQTWVVLGISGLAPYFFETRAVLLVGENGNIGLRAEAEYEALITQKLILTPSIDISAYTKNNAGMGIGSGISNLNIGLRLRYELVREFAPYVGIEWSKNFANTDKLAPLNDVYATIGVRFWF